MTRAIVAILAATLALAAAGPQQRAVHAIPGGPFEASGVTVTPGGRGLLFVDDNRPDGVLWMDLGADGSSPSPPVVIPLGVSVDDPEGITSDGKNVYVVGSQSRGRQRGGVGLVRFRFDAAHRRAEQVETVSDLGSTLAAQVPALNGAKGARKPALNIEGLAWDAKGKRLLLGLRAPLEHGRALVIPVVMDGNGLRVAPPIPIDLGGSGIRGIEGDPDRGSYWILAGGVNNAGTSRLVQWDGSGASVHVVTTLPRALKPEGVARVELGGRSRTLILSDSSQYLLLD
jgi:hypothetical protein